MLGSLSIRARFLFAPILGVFLICLLYFTSNSVIQSHAKLFRELNETNLVQISEISHITLLLTQSHSEIINLLLTSDELDEEEIYEAGKKQLNQLYQVEEELNKSMGDKSGLLIDGEDIFLQIKEAFSAYRFEAISAIEMSSVNTQQALYELELANKKLQFLNHAFLTLSDYNVKKLAQKTQRVERTLYQKTYITELALVIILLMLWCAYYFSRNTAKGLTQVYKALTQLAHGDTKVTLQSNSDAYIKDIWDAVTKFKVSIERSEAYQNELLIQKFAMDQHSIIATTDIKGKITYVNDKFCEISGYSEAELLGGNHRMVNSGHHSKAFWKKMYQTVSTGKVWHSEVLNKSKVGKLYWVDTTIIPMTTLKGVKKVTGYIAIRTDITDKKLQYENLLKATEVSKSAVIAKSQFLATMSHEIRTPMNGIIGMLNLLLKDELSEEQKQRVEIASASAKTLLVLINDILDFSKIDADKLDLAAKDFDICRLLEKFIEFMQYQAQEKSLSIELDMSDMQPVWVVGDENRLRQILTNIVGNAIKFTEQGSIRLKAKLIDLDDLYWQFECEIIDTGIGIPADKLETIFDSFNQADVSTTRKFGGTGLGLAISKRLAELMHGNITVSSETDKGSCFKCVVKFAKSTNTEKPKDPELLRTISLDVPQWPQDTRLLLVEDNRVNQMVAQGVLKQFGLKAEVAVNGIEAFEKFTSSDSPYSLIMMDCQMPLMDGYEATRKIRLHENADLEQQTPIIAMTANAMAGDRQKCLEAGMSDYLSKPINPEELLTKLKQWLLH